MGQALRSSDFLPNPSDLADEVELYKKILDAIADMVLCKGPKSRIVWANKAFCEYYGMSNQELKDIIDAPFNEPDFTQQYIKDDHYVFTTGKTLEIEEPVTRHDGIVRLFSTVKSAVLDRNGHVRMTVGVCRDITEVKQEQEELDLYRKQLEEVVRARTKELSELSESLRVTLHGITDGVISVNAEGNIRIINQSALGMLGRSQEEILGRNIAEVLALVDEHSGAPVSLLKSDEGSKLRIARLRRADAHDLLVEYHTASLNWADGSAPGMVLLFRDVTISKQLEARLLQQQN